MKKIHIILLVAIAAAVAVLVSFLQATSTYDTVATARSKPGKFVHLMASWDKGSPLQYDAINNPNFLSFTAIDTLGEKVKVIYNNPKPENFEQAPRLVMKGKYVNGVFECSNIQTKCPSKYKEEAGSNNTQTTQAGSNEAQPASTRTISELSK